MGLSTLLLLAALHTSVAKAEQCRGGNAKGALEISGLPATYLNGKGGSISGDKLTIEHNSGLTAMSACEEDWVPESIAQLKLLGKAISFTVDLSEVGCGCNLAFYLISSPARDIYGDYSEGKDRDGQPPYYCDANMVGGQWCPEIDLMEANNHAFQATPHNCEEPENGHYSYCDRSGCAANTRRMGDVYGPGSEFRIDSRKPFEVRTEFVEAAGTWGGFRTILTQGHKKVSLDHSTCDSRYLHKLSKALREGMGLRITYWGADASTMTWLDSPPCGRQDCDETAGAAHISNITVTDLPKLKSGVDGSAGKPSDGGAKHKWVSDPFAPWECHHYIGDQQETNWCATADFEGGFEYKYTGGQSWLCGSCWCCQRRAKLIEEGGSVSAAPAPPSWQAAEAAPSPPVWKPVPKTTTEAPDLDLRRGPLKIEGMFRAYLQGTGGKSDGNAITIKHNAGLSVFKAKENDWDPDEFVQFKLLGKAISFTVDLSEVGCACNVAFYLISMPARNYMGKPNAGTNRGGQPPYYCDANKVGGQWCPEIDIMEANNHAFQATLHRCDAPRHRHYDFCDRGGCAENTRDIRDAYGPGKGFTINTLHPFEVDTEFLAGEGGDLVGMRTTLRQNGHKVALEHSLCNAGYLKKLSTAMADGMSLRITYWGDEAQTMAWMDVPPCGETGCKGEYAGKAVVSDIKVRSQADTDDLVWAILDAKDKMLGEIVPSEVIESASFTALHDHGVAEWNGRHHHIRQVARVDLKQAVKELQEDSSDDAGVVAEAPAAPLGVTLPQAAMPGVALDSPAAPWSMVLQKYSPSRASPAFQRLWWPVQLALFAAAALITGFAASVVMRRFKLRPPGGSVQQATADGSQFFHRTSPRDSHAPLSELRSPDPRKISMGASGSMSAGEGPSPMRRSRSASQMLSPPKPQRQPSRQELLALLESAAE